jgi:hypothetical protein
MTPEYEVFAIRYATREARRHEHLAATRTADADGLLRLGGEERRPCGGDRHRLHRGERRQAAAAGSRAIRSMRWR